MNLPYFKRTVLVAILTWLAFIPNGNCVGNGKILRASEFIKPSDADVALGLYKLFQKAKTGGYTSIKFEKGVYHVYGDHAYEKYCFISNHDSGPKKIAFPIIGFDGLE